MAAINGLNLTQWTNLIDSEYIGRRAALAVQTPRTYSGIVNLIDLSMESTRAYAHVLRSHGTAAASLTETDEATTANVTTTQATVSCTRVVKATFVSAQAAGASVYPAASAAIDFVVDANRLYLDDAVHGLSSSMANSIGDNATTMDLDNWVAMLTAYAAQAKNVARKVFVGHPDALRDLQQEILTSAAAILGSDAAASQLFGGAASASMQGVQFMIGQIPVVSTDEIPAADTTGWGNYLTTVGQEDGALGLVMKQDIQVEMTPWPMRQGVYFIGSCDVGVGILDDDRCLQVVSKT